ncbi:hypothetical protein Q1695_012549 [Nippostrongylus brasiliensis]|nr:hypothetical protein Q1695_012549 [Nippostrongylus brasiliensis]
MWRMSVVAVFMLFFVALPVQVQSRNLALSGGISSIFNTPFRVIGKRSQLYTLHKQANYNRHRVPALALDQFDY